MLVTGHVTRHVVHARVLITIVLYLAMGDLLLSGRQHRVDGSLVVHKYSTRVVRTKYGPLRGVIVQTHPPVEAFLGVPYATPPLGSLR